MQQKGAGIFIYIYAHYMKSLRQMQTLIYVFTPEMVCAHYSLFTWD